MRETKTRRVLKNRVLHLFTLQDGRAVFVFYFSFLFAARSSSTLYFVNVPELLADHGARATQTFPSPFDPILEETTMNQANQRLVIISGHMRVIMESF